MKEVYEKVIVKFGNKMQEDMVIEELSELIKAILKYRRAHYDNYEKYTNLSEEIADCEIMLEQLKIMHQCHDNVEMIKQIKLKRLSKMLD